MDCKPITVIETALDQVSTVSKEQPPGSDWQPYGAEIDYKYPNWYNGKKNGFAWCTQFHDDMFIRAYGEEAARALLYRPIKSYGAVVKYAYNYYNAKGHTGKNPIVGASIFFQNKDGLSHIGIVWKYNDDYVWTIEGNTWCEIDKTHYYYVSTHKYARTSSYIYGYGYPCYNNTPIKDEYEIGVTYHVVCTDDLMQRQDASTAAKIYGTLRTDAPVKCEAVTHDKAGNTWIKTGALWCCGKYGGDTYVK